MVPALTASELEGSGERCGPPALPVHHLLPSAGPASSPGRSAQRCIVTGCMVGMADACQSGSSTVAAPQHGVDLDPVR